MFERLRIYLRRWFNTPQPASDRSGGAALKQQAHNEDESIHPIEGDHVYPVPYDENLLEKSRTQWQFGDWKSLARIERDTLQHHPDRAKLALLAAAGHQQNNDMAAARQFIRLAQDWGCSKRLISQILVAGVHNSLGRAAALAGQQPRALQHFESAIAIGLPGTDTKLVMRARVGEQLGQIGLAPGNTLNQLSRIEGPTIAAAPNIQDAASDIVRTVKDEIKTEIHADLKANNPNPYGHNRTLTPSLNKALRDFAENQLQRTGIKQAYIDYLATKTIQIERNCVGRLATTVQDAVIRQLVTECVSGDRICILEIGALYGVSLAILYNHAVTRYSNVQVVCLDPFDGYYGKALDAVLNQPVNDLTFIRNMHLANVPDKDYQIIKHYSNAPAAVTATKELAINLLIIDGDHSYEGVKFDFDTYFPILQPGGYVIFDDYNAKEWPGVQRFINEDVSNTPDFEYIGAISRTAVGRKCASVNK